MSALAGLDSDWINRATRSTFVGIELRRTGRNCPRSSRNVCNEAPGCAHSYPDGSDLILCDRSEDYGTPGSDLSLCDRIENYGTPSRNGFTGRRSPDEPERADHGPSLTCTDCQDSDQCSNGKKEERYDYDAIAHMQILTQLLPRSCVGSGQRCAP